MNKSLLQSKPATFFLNHQMNKNCIILYSPTNIHVYHAYYQHILRLGSTEINLEIATRHEEHSFHAVLDLMKKKEITQYFFVHRCGVIFPVFPLTSCRESILAAASITEQS